MRVSNIGWIAKTFLGIMSCSILASCQFTQPQPEKPINIAAKATVSYIQAKRAYVEALESAIRGLNPSESSFRLVAVTGPQWPIGQVIDIDNPLNVLTDKCLIPKEIQGPAIPWTSLPGLSQTRNIDLSAGLPNSVLKFLRKTDQVGVTLNLTQTGDFALTELKSTIIPKDKFDETQSDECTEFLAFNGGYVVRGVVTGKENFRSGNDLKSEVDLKVLESELLSLKFNNKGDFNLEDKNETPKMFLVEYHTPV